MPLPPSARHHRLLEIVDRGVRTGSDIPERVLEVVRVLECAGQVMPSADDCLTVSASGRTALAALAGPPRRGTR